MKKLYYDNPYIKSFHAVIEKQAEDEQGRLYAVLNQTAFYPTGGGQPHDIGTINDIKVIDVEEIDGEIRHYIEHPISQAEAVCSIDWERRLDHMQQHTGQHILSAAFAENFGYMTVGFHLGKDIVTIDLDTKELTEEQVHSAEALSNSIIFENRPVETKWVDAAELVQYPLRKQPAVQENIRLVIIPDFDYNGCGGTHPVSTGQVSAVKILDWERQKKKTRVSFVCGNRVLQNLHQKNKTVKALSQLLSAPENELAMVANRVLEHGKTIEKELEEAKLTLIKYEGIELLKEAKMAGNQKVVGKVFHGRPIQDLQNLARQIAAHSPESIIFLINDGGEKLQFVCAKGSEPDFSMKEISAKLLPMIDGKGGGNESFAQGGGEPILTAESLLDKAIGYVI
ncbi:DHHA1 domain-containing protein [Cytobacillus horneckiae]|uniref:alanyl-tRNA editing protein n=1 Tax=Cytobacillus horneckiae TaxID=549687 RepID=UPI00399FF78A